MPKNKKVALCFSLTSGLGRNVVKGLIAYIHKHGSWKIDIRSEEPIAFASWEEIQHWEGDGIIAPVYQESQVELLRKKGLPVVNTTVEFKDTPFPTVSFDNEAIGRMAAEHLLEHDLDRFAFIGPGQWEYSHHRCRGFSEVLSRHGAACGKHWIRSESGDKQPNEPWINASLYLDMLKQMQLPIGVFAHNDRVAYGILQACYQLGLRVPEEVCVIGVGNDDILCNLAPPNLSSISLPGEEFGYRAAAMLDAQMRGETLESKLVLIPPERVVLRNSSDFLTVEDRYVADALRYIRNHSSRFIDVSDVMRIIPVSRRSLERRFKNTMGHGIYKEITHCHIKQAKELLGRTDWPISRIARESGFNATNRFEDTFRKHTGMSATAYRKKLKAAG